MESWNIISTDRLQMLSGLLKWPKWRSSSLVELRKSLVNQAEAELGGRREAEC